MRSDQDAWQRLGIAPGSDTRTIKQAYARLLKTIDVEADKVGFVTLREAMEQAIAQTAAEPSPASTSGTISSRPIETIPPTIETIRAKLSDLAVALTSDGGDDPKGNRIETSWNLLMAEPELQKADVAPEIEQRLAAMIARNAPRSNALLQPAITRLGWSDETGATSNRDIRKILARQRDLDFLAHAANGEHAQGWAALQILPSETPARQLRGAEDAVGALLRKIRFDHPGAESALDRAKADAWITHLEQGWWDFSPNMAPDTVFDEPSENDWDPDRRRKGHWTRWVWPSIFAFIALHILAIFLL